MKIIKEIIINTEFKVILFDWSSNGGIRMTDKFNNKVWEIKNIRGNPYTNIFLENKELKAHRWDGGIYKIDLNSGAINPERLMI